MWWEATDGVCAAHCDWAKSSSPFFRSSSACALNALTSSASMTLLAAFDFFPIVTVYCDFSETRACAAKPTPELSPGLPRVARTRQDQNMHPPTASFGLNVEAWLYRPPGSFRRAAGSSPNGLPMRACRRARLVGFLERRDELVKLLSCELDRHLANGFRRVCRSLGVCVRHVAPSGDRSGGKRRQPRGMAAVPARKSCRRTSGLFSEEAESDATARLTAQLKSLSCAPIKFFPPRENREGGGRGREGPLGQPPVRVPRIGAPLESLLRIVRSWSRLLSECAPLVRERAGSRWAVAGSMGARKGGEKLTLKAPRALREESPTRHGSSLGEGAPRSPRRREACLGRQPARRSGEAEKGP